eukprot:1385353-Rhodomonas_salina.1
MSPISESHLANREISVLLHEASSRLRVEGREGSSAQGRRSKIWPAQELRDEGSGLRVGG